MLYLQPLFNENLNFQQDTCGIYAYTANDINLIFIYESIPFNDYKL